MKWIAALALILQFLAFWFAAPELLGEKTLKRFEDGLRKFISLLPVIIFGLFVLGVSISYSVYGILTGIRASEEGVSPGDMMQYYVIIGISMLFYFVIVAFSKRIIRYMEIRLARPLIQKLIHQSEIRKNALIMGAVLFTLSFMIQLTLVLL